jgi:hypothetical protein
MRKILFYFLSVYSHTPTPTSTKPFLIISIRGGHLLSINKQCNHQVISEELAVFLVGLGIPDKKIIPRKTELTEQMVISDEILAVPRNRNSRNSVPNPSAEEKTTRNSVPRNSNRSKLSELPSEPFSGRENNSEFRSEPFHRRENNSEQNAAAAISDSTQIECSCREC